MSTLGLLRPARAVDVFPTLISLDDLAPRIRTGCVFEAQSEDTCGVLVTREAPRRLARVRSAIHAHWRWCAPSIFLLTGHTTLCRHRQCHPNEGQTAGHTCDSPAPRQRIGWEAFAVAYRAELDRWPRLAHVAAIHQIARWLQTFETVTLLSFEPSLPRGAALAAWRGRDEFVPYAQHAQRHILWDWLLTQPLR